MSEKNMDSSKKPTKRDPDLVAAEIAMKRAAAKARQRAKQAGVGVVVLKDGRIIEERQNTSAGD
jgi:LDH2 family malate/lactate/ureidoglycolate dehydrogenase